MRWRHPRRRATLARRGRCCRASAARSPSAERVFIGACRRQAPRGLRRIRRRHRKASLGTFGSAQAPRCPPSACSEMLKKRRSADKDGELLRVGAGRASTHRPLDRLIVQPHPVGEAGGGSEGRGPGGIEFGSAVERLEREEVRALIGQRGTVRKILARQICTEYAGTTVPRSARFDEPASLGCCGSLGSTAISLSDDTSNCSADDEGGFDAERVLTTSSAIDLARRPCASFRKGGRSHARTHAHANPRTHRHTPHATPHAQRGRQHVQRLRDTRAGQQRVDAFMLLHRLHDDLWLCDAIGTQARKQIGAA